MNWNTGAGSPNTFRCWKCRRRAGQFYGRPDMGAGRFNRVDLTGKKRERSAKAPGALGLRSSWIHYQYECFDCGHIGWSNHRDLAAKANREPHRFYEPAHAPGYE